jgi:excisionase family DNA binding protein
MPRVFAFTTSQAAAYLGVSQMSIRRWCADGYLQHHLTPGGQLRFSREQLEDFVASRRHGDRAAANGRVTV